MLYGGYGRTNFWFGDENAWIGTVPINKTFLSQETLMVQGFLLVSACSGCFWTLTAGSVIGGMVFTVAGEILGTTLVYFIVAKITDNENVFPFVLAVVAPCYSSLFLWLGWRKFSRLQLKESAMAEVGGRDKILAGLRSKARFLHCRPNSKYANLIRKELGLQQPVFSVALVFIAGWIVVGLLARLQPARHETYEMILGLMTGAYVPVISLMAGCVPVSDEKAMGITAWQLTFPLSPVRQWIIKLGVALAVTFVCLLIPCLMASILAPSPSVFPAAVLNFSEKFIQVLLACEVVTLIGFWAATSVEGNVRAILTTLLVCGLVCAATALGIWSAEQFEGLETMLILALLDIFHVSVQTLSRPIVFAGPSIILGGILLALVAARSLAQFRRIQIERRSVLAWTAFIIVLACLGGFWANDFIKSMAEAGKYP
jgi:hypothetical protein